MLRAAQRADESLQLLAASPTAAQAAAYCVIPTLG
jgi:hypothetical protein